MGSFSDVVNMLTRAGWTWGGFINRPTPPVLRYELLKETPPGRDDIETIPAVLDVIKGLGKGTGPGVVSAKQRVEL